MNNGWIIVCRRPNVGNKRKYFLASGKSYDMYQWTREADKALIFKTKELANAVLAGLIIAAMTKKNDWMLTDFMAADVRYR